MKKTLITLTVMLAAVVLVVVFCGSAMAKVAGRCDNCHTMHASQTPWNTNWDNSVEGNPQKYLLGNDCVGCHSHASEMTYTLGTEGAMSTVPVVYITGTEPQKYLAGGNFYWVAQTGEANDPKGHNVLGIKEQDFYLKEAPGRPDITCSTDCHVNLAATNTGCTGCHLHPMHHADDHPIGESGLVNSYAQGWYRFLSGHSAEIGVHGYEHFEWEKGHPDLPTGQTDNHNEYLGEELNHAIPAIHVGLTTASTTTAYCCGCHGNFHVQSPTDRAGNLRDWTRHPSDAVLPDSTPTVTSEYADYTSYDPLSPVARATVTTSASGDVTAGSDMVMCLSCHRPHGSPYDDLLRWDYTTMNAGGGGADKGCFACHTTKN